MKTYIHRYIHTHTYVHLYIYIQHIYIHTYTHTNMHIHTHTHIYIYMYMHVCTYVCIYIYTYIRTHMLTYIYIYTYIHTYTYAYVHIYIHTYTHTYIHTYKQLTTIHPHQTTTHLPAPPHTTIYKTHYPPSYSRCQHTVNTLRSVNWSHVTSHTAIRTMCLSSIMSHLILKHPHVVSHHIKENNTALCTLMWCQNT